MQVYISILNLLLNTLWLILEEAKKHFFLYILSIFIVSKRTGTITLTVNPKFRKAHSENYRYSTFMSYIIVFIQLIVQLYSFAL